MILLVKIYRSACSSLLSMDYLGLQHTMTPNEIKMMASMLCELSRSFTGDRIYMLSKSNSKDQVHICNINASVNHLLVSVYLHSRASHHGPRQKHRSNKSKVGDYRTSKYESFLFIENSISFKTTLGHGGA